MRTLDTDGEKFVVRFEFHPSLLNAVKALPGRRFDKEQKLWTIPSSSVAEVAEFVRKHRFTVTPAALAMGKAARSLSKQSRAIELDDDFSVAGVHPVKCSRIDCEGKLRPFQLVGVKYALQTKRTFIADKVGLGKTVEALVTAHAAGAFPCVVVTTASGKNDWAREVKHWIPSRSVEVVNGKVPVNTKADIVVTSWSVLKYHAESLNARGLKATVFDESHSAKDAKAQRSKAAMVLTKDVEYRLNLSATPFKNRNFEVISQLDLLGRLNDFGGFWGLAKRYCNAHKVFIGRRAVWDFSDSINTTELNERLRATCYIQRLKKDVLSELPPVQHAPVDIDITNLKEYRRAEADVIAYLRDIDIEKAGSAEMAEAIVQIGVLRRLAARGKLAGIAEWVDNFLESGEKLIVFAWHQEIVEELGRLFKCPAVTGGVSKKKFDAIVEDFQTNPETKLLVMNIQVGGEQKTLTAASNVAFAEYGWNWATHEQAIGRVYGRLNDVHGANAWWLRALDTIDDTMLEMVEHKRVITETATDGGSVESHADAGIREFITTLLNKAA